MKNNEKTMIQQKLISFLAHAPFSTLPVAAPLASRIPSKNGTIETVAGAKVSRQVSPVNSAAAKSTWSSDEILAGRKEVIIQHGEATYRLTHTKTGKLILHK
jgi:hemin uptake protein HemP